MPIKGIFYLSITALTYGMLHIVDKAALKYGADPGLYTILQVALAAVFLSFYTKVRGKHSIRSIFRKPYLKDLVIIGILTTGIGLLFKIEGLSYSSATNVSLMLTLVAPMTSLFAFFYLKEKITRRFIAASAIMLCGVWAIYFKNDYSPFGWGDFLIILAIIFFACGNVYIRKTLTHNVPVSLVTLGRFVFGALSLVLVLPFLSISFDGLRQAFWLMLLGSAIFGIRMAAYHKGIEIAGASQAATFILVSPVVSVIGAHFLLGEPVTGSIFIGIILVLGGTALMLAKSPKSDRRLEKAPQEAAGS
jgi:drug/metabolite transporter (DMT)-like permease